MDGDARLALRCAYGYKSNFFEPNFSIDVLISEIAFCATDSSSSFSIATKHTTISSNRTLFGSISSATEISFLIGVYSMLSQCNCNIRMI